MLVAAASLGAQTPTPGALSGVIVQVEDQHPIPRVQLRLVGPGPTRRMVSDAEGHFRFALLPAGTWTLETPGIVYGDAEVVRPNRLKKIKVRPGKTTFIKIEVRSTGGDPIGTGRPLLDFSKIGTGRRMDSQNWEHLPVK